MDIGIDRLDKKEIDRLNNINIVLIYISDSYLIWWIQSILIFVRLKNLVVGEFVFVPAFKTSSLITNPPNEFETKSVYNWMCYKEFN